MESPENRKRAIREYFEIEAPDETIEHLERVANERVLGDEYDVWDVHTDQARWWLISNPTNLYRQDLIKSMSVALSFHIGLTLRVMARDSGSEPPDGDERFSAAWRRLGQAHEALDEADEAEDFQAVGMRCRECLLMFARAIATDRVKAEHTGTPPKVGDFVGWVRLVANLIAPGESAKERRSYLKTTAEAAWTLASWLTHAQNATRFDGHMVLDATAHAMNTMSLALLRWERGDPDRCPDCGSYRITPDLRQNEDDDTFEHYTLCEACGWTEIARPPEPRHRAEVPIDATEDYVPPPPPPSEDEVLDSSTIRTFETPEDFINRRS